MLHYYHAADPSKATPVAAAVLDDALTLLEHGVWEDVHPPQSVLRPARAVVSRHLSTVISATIRPAEHAPRLPDLARLRDHGIREVDDEQFAEAVSALAQRWRRLLSMIEDDVYRCPQ